MTESYSRRWWIGRWDAQNRNDDRNLRVVYLNWNDGRVCLNNNYANDDNEFNAANHFAVLASSL